MANDTRKTYGNGRIRSLSKRLSPEQQAKRATKIEARRVVAETLAREIGLTRLATGQEFLKFRKRQRYDEAAIVVAIITLLYLVVFHAL